MSFMIPYAAKEVYQQPNKISDLLLRSAALQAEGQRRSGEIWGGTVASLGKTVADTLTELHRQKQNAPLIAAKTEGELAQTANEKFKLENSRREQTRQATREAATSNPNRQEALSALAGDPQGQSDLVKSFEAIDKYHDGILGEVGYQLTKNNFSPQAVSFAAKEMKDKGFDPQLIQQIASDPEALKAQATDWLAKSSDPRHQALLTAKAPIKVGVGGGREALIDPTTNKPVYEPPPEAAKPETRSLEVQAAEALAKGDKATYSRLMKVKKEMGQADDKPGALKSVAVMNEKGETVLANYQSSSGKYFDSAGVEIKNPKKPLGATDSNRANAAEAVNATGNDIVAKLSDPAFKAIVGPLMGRASTLRDLIGNPPPEFSELAGEIESYAFANMGVHGMRSVQGSKEISKLLDAKHTPESLIAAIKGLQGFSNNYLAAVGRGKKQEAPAKPAPPPATPQKVGKFLVEPGD